MKNLNLSVSLQGIQGRKTKTQKAGFGAFTVQTDGASTIQISVDTYTGFGSTYKRRENAEVTISFFDGQTEPWRGTPEELKEILIHSKKEA